MECACFSVDNDDYVTMLASNKRRAVKHHRCDECRGTIFPGQTYLEERYLFDGTVSTHKTCSCCQSVREHLFRQFTYGQLWSDLNEHLYGSISYGDEIPWSKISGLTQNARAHVLLLIEEIWASETDEDEEDE